MENWSGNAFTYTQNKNGYIVEYAIKVLSIICVVYVKCLEYSISYVFIYSGIPIKCLLDDFCNSLFKIMFIIFGYMQF